MSGTSTTNAAVPTLHRAVLTVHKVTLTALAPAKHAVTNAWADAPGHPHMTPAQGEVVVAVVVALVLLFVLRIILLSTFSRSYRDS